VEWKKVKIESSDKGTRVKRGDLVRWLKGTTVFNEWSSGKWF
jgi:histidyl-tRNA synthetase